MSYLKILTKNDAVEILSELESLGVWVRVVGDKIRFSPEERVTPEMKERIRLRKPELMDILYMERFKHTERYVWIN